MALYGEDIGSKHQNSFEKSVLQKCSHHGIALGSNTNIRPVHMNDCTISKGQNDDEILQRQLIILTLDGASMHIISQAFKDIDRV